MVIKFVKRVLGTARRLMLKLKTKSKLAAFSEIKRQCYNDLVVRGYAKDDELQVASIYSQLNEIEFSSFHKKLYSGFGSKLLIVAESKVSGKLVGMDMFYFNPRDFKEDTVHEGFIGVLPEAQGQGLATLMRKAAVEHFSKNGLEGISTRISISNLGSLRSAEKLGFKVVDEYFDKPMNEGRCYMVLKLNRR